MRIKKGDLLRYVGSYAPEVPKDAEYGVGQVVAFRNRRQKVTVLLIEESEELYADWPVDKVQRVES